MHRKLPILIGIAFAASVQAAGIYKWTDANGVVHYGDRRPAEQRAELTPIPAIAPVGTVAPEAPDARPRKPPARGPARSDARVDALRLAEKCHRARLQLKDVRAIRRAGYRASRSGALDRREARARADIGFYCR